MAAKEDETGVGPSKKEEESIPGYKNVLDFSSQALRALMMATKASNDLPNAGDDFDYYSSFEGFRDVMDMESKRLLESIQTVMRYHGIKGNIIRNADATELEDKFDILVDANDQLLERVGTFLDEAAGLNKQESPLVIASTPKQISGSWNKKTSKKGVLGNYKLLSAKFIPRPQLKFKDKIDNSSRPFVPKIKEKPHATQPLSDSLILAQKEDKTLTIVDDQNIESLIFPNPYKYELDHYTYPDAIYEEVNPQEPPDLESTMFEMITDLPRLNALIKTLRNVTELAIDLEAHSFRSFLGITCLMQISTRTNDYIVDTLALRSDLYRLNEVFTNPSIIKVLHGADMDIVWLQRDLGLYMVGMFDTGQASRVLSFPSFSLAHLLLKYCNVTADKQFQLADWRIRPLPDELVKYAREDTHYLLYIYDLLRKELLDRGNEQKNLLNAVLHRSTQLCARTYMKPIFTPEKYLELYQKQRKIFNAQQLHALKRIYTWRDETARIEDESEGYVLPNHMMLQISELLPKETQGILACCNPIPPLVRQNLSTLSAILAEAREMSINRPAIKTVTPTKPSWKDHPKYQERMSNPLLSPHDLSHCDKRPGGGQYGVPESDLVADESSLFGKAGSGRVASVTMATKPIITAYSWGPQVVPEMKKAAEKAAKIKSDFLNPFEMFLPHKLLPSTGRKPRPATAMWQLKKHTAKVKAVVKPRAEPSTLGKAKILKTEEEVGMVPITLTEMADQEEQPKKSRKEKAKAMKSGPIQRVAAIPSSSKSKSSEKPDTSNATQKQDQKQTVRIERPAGNGTEISRKRKKEKLTMEDLEEEGFKGHDYSQSDFTIFSESSAKKGKKNKKKGKKEYNPDAVVLKSDFQNARKPRLNPLSGQKDMTFGQSSKTEQTSWPKR